MDAESPGGASVNVERSAFDDLGPQAAARSERRVWPFTPFDDGSSRGLFGAGRERSFGERGQCLMLKGERRPADPMSIPVAGDILAVPGLAHMLQRRPLD